MFVCVNDVVFFPITEKMSIKAAKYFYFIYVTTDGKK